jgi:multiple sugar transport system permease protein
MMSLALEKPAAGRRCSPFARPRAGRPSPLGSDAPAAAAFLTPTLAHLLLFTAFPVLFSLYMSFHEWNAISAPRFAGADNYGKLLRDPQFIQSFWNTLYFTAGTVVPRTALALGLALLINAKIRGQAFYRSAYFLPALTPLIAISQIWLWIFEPSVGLVNGYLRALGIVGPPWLSSTEWAMPAVIIMTIWSSVGYYMVIYLAGLQGIPGEIYEAARIDGAGGWRAFRAITLPLLGPTTFFVVVISVIASAQAFGQIYVLTQGGPAGATTVLAWYLYQTAFQYLESGYASAIAWVMFLIIFGLTLVQWLFARRDEA